MEGENVKGEGGDGDARTHHPTVPQAIPDWLYQSTVAMLKESGLASRFDLSMLMKPAVHADIDKCVGHKQTLAIAKEQRLAYVQKTALAVGSSTAAAVAFADATGDCVVLVGDNVDNVRSSVGLSEPCLQPLVIQDSANNFILDGNGKKVALVHHTIENQSPIDVAQFYGVDVGSIMALTKTYSDLHPTMKPDSRLMFNTVLYVPVQSAERRSGAGVRQGGGGGRGRGCSSGRGSGRGRGRGGTKGSMSTMIRPETIFHHPPSDPATVQVAKNDFVATLSYFDCASPIEPLTAAESSALAKVAVDAAPDDHGGTIRQPVRAAASSKAKQKAYTATFFTETGEKTTTTISRGYVLEPVRSAVVVAPVQSNDRNERAKRRLRDKDALYVLWITLL